MTTENKIKNEKLQYAINRKAAKSYALSSSITNKQEYIKGEEILHISQRKIVENSRFTCSPPNRILEKTNEIRLTMRLKSKPWLEIQLENKQGLSQL